MTGAGDTIPTIGGTFSVAEMTPEVRALRAAYAATRALLKVKDPDAAQAIIIRLSEELGAEVVTADQIDADALPLALNLDDGELLLLRAPDAAVERLVSRYVVPALDDAKSIVNRRRSERSLTVDATRDGLTNLWNRRSLERAVNASTAGDCVALLDLDHFKHVNDTHGHAAGDEVLARFATFLRVSVREGDIVGRLGGEEFVILFPGTVHHAACGMVNRMREQWDQIAPYSSTFSAGLASVASGDDDGGARPGQLALARADALMYEAKSAGRNRVVCEAHATSTEGDGA